MSSITIPIQKGSTKDIFISKFGREKLAELLPKWYSHFTSASVITKAPNLVGDKDRIKIRIRWDLKKAIKFREKIEENHRDENILINRRGLSKRHIQESLVVEGGSMAHSENSSNMESSKPQDIRNLIQLQHSLRDLRSQYRQAGTLAIAGPDRSSTDTDRNMQREPRSETTKATSSDDFKLKSMNPVQLASYSSKNMKTSENVVRYLHRLVPYELDKVSKMIESEFGLFIINTEGVRVLLALASLHMGALMSIGEYCLKNLGKLLDIEAVEDLIIQLISMNPFFRNAIATFAIDNLDNYKASLTAVKSCIESSIRYKQFNIVERLVDKLENQSISTFNFQELAIHLARSCPDSLLGRVGRLVIMRGIGNILNSKTLSTALLEILIRGDPTTLMYVEKEINNNLSELLETPNLYSTIEQLHSLHNESTATLKATLLKCSGYQLSIISSKPNLLNRYLRLVAKCIDNLGDLLDLKSHGFLQENCHRLNRALGDPTSLQALLSSIDID